MPLTRHLADADVAAALDPLGGGRAGAVARAHAASCDACRAAIDAARADHDDVAHWLAALDHPVPVVDPQVVLDRARPTTVRAPIAARRAAVVARLPLWGAGAMLVGVTAAAAAVLPNSPVRHMVERIAHVGAGAQATAAPPATTTDVAPAASVRGVAIIPTGDVEITFASTQRRGSVRLVHAGGAALTVESDADGPTYTVGANSIAVHNDASDSATYRVLIPAGSGALRILIAGRTAYERAGRDPAAARSAAIVLPLHAPAH